MNEEKLNSLKAYIESNVEAFQPRYAVALEQIGINRSPLQHEDPELWSEILNAAEDWCADNECDLWSEGLDEQLREWYD